MRVFRNRREAGLLLAERLRHLGRDQPIVLGLPRGGVPVAAEVARALHAPLDVIVVRKLGVPYQPELGMGAIGEDGARVLNDDVIRLARVTSDDIEAVEAREREEITRRARRFRGGRPPLVLEGRTVIVVDDGIATGGTARAALQVARARGARRVILAVPVAPADTLDALAEVADEIICLEAPTDFFAVGQWYADFTQTTDADVVALLAETDPAAPVIAGGSDDRPHDQIEEDVEIPSGPVTLSGHLSAPDHPIGIVVFVHGSGSSRHSPRNRFVSRALNAGRLATVLFDLLTPDEEIHRANVFDIQLLADRLTTVTAWVSERPGLAGPPDRLLRCQHGCRGCVVGRRSSRRTGAGGRVTRRTARPGGPPSRRRPCADLADRRGARHGSPRAQP
jgi:putative phosphoribosyl transferase